jgi:alpha-methylacyl-CoA racemase
VLIEGHRPGVAERLGIGPADCHARNPRLVYGRMTGWGQDGPLAERAGHDITYVAVTGALHAIGEAGGPPQVPLNLVGDFGGGGPYLVMGVLAGLLEARQTHMGQVVDAAIVDGVAHMLAGTHAMLNTGTWADERGMNLFDGGAPFYALYETADRRHMAVGAIEPKFYAELVATLELDLDAAAQHDRATWVNTRAEFAKAFRSRTQEEWSEVFESVDACVAPVASLRESALHPHLAARGSVVVRDGVVQPGRAPRFTRSSVEPGPPPAVPGRHTREVLNSWGVDPEPLLASGAAYQAR